MPFCIAHHHHRASLGRSLALWVMLRQRSQDTALAAAQLRSRALLSHALAAWVEAVASTGVEESLRKDRLRFGLRLAERRRCAAVLEVWLHRVRWVWVNCLCFVARFLRSQTTVFALSAVR